MRKLLISLCVAIPLYLFSSLDVGAFTVLNPIQERQVQCLAENVYHESKGESIRGQMAVAIVTMNRLNNDNFPGDVCQVTRQRDDGMCQFSWYCNKKKREYLRKGKASKDISYIKSKYIAEYVYFNYQNLQDPTHGALYFHANYVKVRVKGKVKKAVIGKHIFYDIKEKKKKG